MILRKLIAWPLCQACYYVGDWTASAINRCPSSDDDEPSRFCMALLAVYQFFMNRSYRLNEWGGLRVWYPPEEGGPDWRAYSEGK